ncbi:MAG: hypothetical protein AB7F21_02070 [Desulfuromonadales bacterium]|jgi:hypothetical protein|uniref:hypothetical protein n=1 Tax=Desulfuromonas sp. KJ2020 TaxID=2919173 RepID=UPI0020A74A5B|nr:hypothetical protein [Desulfuromonas sp. KJ2020]MCP3175776.1 hypothetical protein [Desulfuromonas sp. KJ2020]
MKATRILSAAASMWIVSVVPALAAAGREDSSGLVVWVFLGFCALIVVAQLLPAAMMLFGLIKGAFSPAPKVAKSQINE